MIIRKCICFLILTLTLVGCGKVSPYPEITGYIMKREGLDILVVESIDSKEERPENALKTHIPLLSLGRVHLGDKVKVWVRGGVDDSSPAQASSGKIEVLPASTPEGANLSESQALKKALENREYEHFDNEIALLSISYATSEDVWTITLKDLGVEGKEIIKVDDK